jgi:hypothetical protein
MAMAAWRNILTRINISLRISRLSGAVARIRVTSHIRRNTHTITARNL